MSHRVSIRTHGVTLTPQQELAIHTLDRDVGVLASAGSGKTTVLAAHYSELLTNGRASPKRLLVFTFTEKAAAELKERIEETLRRSAAWEDISHYFWSEAWIGTIHQFCGRLCRQNAHLLNLNPLFTITENEISLARFHSLLKDTLRADMAAGNPRTLDPATYYGIDKFEGLLLELHRKKVPPPCLRAHPLDDALIDLYTCVETAFEEEKRATHALDFDDLESNAIVLLEKFPEVRIQYQSLFAHILVDEFQDLSTAQGRLIDLLWQPGKNRLFFVGDPKQSIYGFRGANVDIFDRFWQKLTETDGRQIVLAENWRSAPSLLDFTNAVFHPLFSGGADDDIPKVPYTPMTTTQAFAGVAVHQFLHETIADNRRLEEARFIVGQIEALTAQGLPWREIAVICRSSRFFAHLAPMLEARQIPYDTQKSRLLAREPFVLLVQTLFTYLVSPKDEPSRLGLMYSDIFGMTVADLVNTHFASPADNTAWARVEQALSIALLQENALTALLPSDRLEHFRRSYETCHGTPFFKTTYHSFLYFRFLGYLTEEEKKGNKTPRAWRRWLQTFEIHSPHSPKPLGASLENKVQLLTVHAAKGLEFEAVFLADLNSRGKTVSDLVLVDRDTHSVGWQEIARRAGFGRKLTPTPAFDCIKEKDKRRDFEESKRLLYVAATRAKRLLFLQTLPLSAAKSKKAKSILDFSSWNDWISYLIETNTLTLPAPTPTLKSTSGNTFDVLISF